MEAQQHMSVQVKEFLSRKLTECKQKLIKLKRKRNKIKIMYITSILLSTSIAGSVTILSMMTTPAFIVPTLSAFSGMLTAISSRFNFQNKKAEVKELIAKLNKIQSKLDHVISCNGDLTPDEYQQIMKDFETF